MTSFRFHPGIPAMLLVVAVSILPVTVQAARNYQVDLIVFTQAAATADNAEQWTDLPPPLDPSIMASAVTPEELKMDSLPDPDQQGATMAPPAEARDVDFADVLARIQKDPDRKVILATSWVQSVQDPDNTPILHITDRDNVSEPVPIGGSSSIRDRQPTALGSMAAEGIGIFQQPPLIDGFVRFFLSGYYTLELDIRYTPEIPFLERDDPENPQLISYRIHEKRRMKSDELNYYDHPKFGVLLLVNPAATAEAGPTP